MGALIRWMGDHWPYILIALGGVLAVTGGLFAAIHQTRFERELREKTDRAIASITGGDSYGEVMAFYYDPGPTDRGG